MNGQTDGGLGESWPRHGTPQPFMSSNPTTSTPREAPRSSSVTTGLQFDRKRFYSNQAPQDKQHFQNPNIASAPALTPSVSCFNLWKKNCSPHLCSSRHKASRGFFFYPSSLISTTTCGATRERVEMANTWGRRKTGSETQTRNTLLTQARSKLKPKTLYRTLERSEKTSNTSNPIQSAKISVCSSLTSKPGAPLQRTFLSQEITHELTLQDSRQCLAGLQGTALKLWKRWQTLQKKGWRELMLGTLVVQNSLVTTGALAVRWQLHWYCFLKPLDLCNSKEHATACEQVGWQLLEKAKEQAKVIAKLLMCHISFVRKFQVIFPVRKSMCIILATKARNPHATNTALAGKLTAWAIGVAQSVCFIGSLVDFTSLGQKVPQGFTTPSAS